WRRDRVEVRVWGQRRRPSPGRTRPVHSLCPLQTTSWRTASRRMEVSGRARTDLQDQFGDLLIDLASLLHLPGDLVHRVDHSRVVALAEDPPDGRIAVVR